MADVEYKATLDDREVLQALRNIDKNMARLADQGDRSFTKVGKSAKAGGLQIGAITGVVTALTQKFIQLAEEGVRAFLEIAKGGVELNKALELLQIRVTNILDGNQEAAVAFLEQTRQAARELKLDYIELAELATTILPDAKDLEVSAKLAGQTLLLARAIGADAKRAQISIIEALAGQYVSIRRVLNLSSQQIKEIQKLAPEIGQAAAISKVLGDRLQAIGFNAEDIAASFTGLFGLLQAEAKDLQRIFAEPVFEELKEQAAAFLKVFAEHRDDIERVAVAFGQFLADVVELVGTNLVQLIDTIDYDLLEDTADAFSDIIAAADAFFKIITDGDINTALEAIRDMAEDIAEAMYTAVLAAALLKAEIAKRQAEAAALQEQGRGLRVGPVVIGTAEDPRVAAAGQEAYNEVMEEQVAIIEELNKRLAENRERARERRKETKGDAKDSLDAAQAALDQAAALEKLAEAEEAAAEARKKLSERLAEIAIDRERRLLEIQIKAGRELLEDAIKAAQKREDLARENAQKIEDIWRDHQQSIADAATDLSRDEEDIARKAARRQIEQARDEANSRLDIEREYRRELERIRARFDESAQEAERRNDAQAYLEAMRQRDREVEDARRTRDENLEDAARRAEEQRAALREQLQYELEDARIANRRKLEDLQLRLERELEAQRINYQRDVEEQALAEQRKTEERQRAYQQELEDFARKEFQRLQDLNRSLQTEFETIKKYEELKREVRVAEALRTVEQVNAIFARLKPFGGTTYPYYYRGPEQRQYGGEVEAGRPYRVGEAGPEIFIPAQKGMIVPNAAISPAMTISNAYDYSRRMDVGGINLAESLFDNPVTIRKMQNIILSTLSQAL